MYMHLLPLLFLPYECTNRICLFLVYGCHRPVTGSHLQFIPALALKGPADKSMIEGNDCTFVSDFSKIQLQSNTETLGEHESLESWQEG